MSAPAAAADALEGLKAVVEEAPEAEVSRDRYGYKVDGEFLRRVTTLCGGLPKPWLGGWAAKSVAEFAVENKDTWQSLGKRDAIKLLKGSPWSKRDDAADRGTAVHEAAEALVRGRPIPDLEHDDEIECAIVVEAFLEEFVDRPLASELTVFNRTVGYAGTLDLWCVDVHGVTWLLDWKTSKDIYVDHAVQQAAYLNAEYAVVQKKATGSQDEEKWTGRVIPWGPDRVKRVGIVHVTPEGAELRAIRESQLPRLWTVFRAAAHVKMFLLDTDDYRKDPRVEIYEEPQTIRTRYQES